MIKTPLFFSNHEKTYFEIIDDTGNHIGGYESLEICTQKCMQAMRILPTRGERVSETQQCPISGHECQSIVECSDRILDAEMENNICTQGDGSPGLCCENISFNVGFDEPVIPEDLLEVRTQLDIQIDNATKFEAASNGTSFAEQVTNINLNHTIKDE